MVTDAERREVARRLRELELGVIGALIPTGELAENILKAIGYGRSGAMTPYGCLADLIEPRDMSHGCRDTVACDRDALLALADEMDAYTCCPDDDRCGKQMPPSTVHGFARRIREALGVES